MTYNKIEAEKKAGVAWITLNRPQKLNALDAQLLGELVDALADADKDSAIAAVVIRGKGKAFCVGADLEFVGSYLGDPNKCLDFLKLMRKTCAAIENLSLPVVASVQGLALAGGLELVLACDLAVAANDARIGDQHAKYGLIAGGGGTQLLPRIIGIRKAKELLLTGSWMSGVEAERFGLVNKAVPAEKLDATVAELAADLASKSPLAAERVKKLVARGMEVDLDAALELEMLTALAHFSSPDLAEGINAFREKRQPQFKKR